MTTDANGIAGKSRRRINRWRVAGWTLAALLILLPAVAMRIDDGVNWTLSDFVFAGVLIGGPGLGFDWVARRSGNIAYRMGGALFLLAAFLLVWINAAVGIIGNEDHPLNLLYLGVIAIGAIGGIARFRPRGLFRAMLAAAAAQTAMTIVAVVGGRSDPPGAIGMLILNGVFVGMFVVAAWLFSVVAKADRTAQDRRRRVGAPRVAG